MSKFISSKLKASQVQYDELSRVSETLRRDLLELQKFKSAFESNENSEETNFRLIKDNMDFENQATLFYEALLMKRAQIIKMVKELKSKDSELEIIKRKSKNDHLLIKQREDIESLKLEVDSLKSKIEHYKIKEKELISFSNDRFFKKKWKYKKSE